MLRLNDPSVIAALLVEAGGKEESIDAVVEHDEFGWTVTFDDGATCVVRMASTPARLVLSGSVGQPAPDCMAELHALALSFNLLVHETGGCRIARGEDEELVLVQELSTDSLDEGDLAGHLMGFEVLRALWEHIVVSHQSPPKPAELMNLVNGIKA